MIIFPWPLYQEPFLAKDKMIFDPLFMPIFEIASKQRRHPMTTYYNAMTATEDKNGKTHFNKVGVAFPGKPGSKLITKIKLFATPINGEILLFEPNSNDDDPVTLDEPVID